MAVTTSEQAEALVWRIRRTLIQLTNGRQPVLTTGARMGLDEIERKLLDAVRRDNTPGPDRDGHRTNSIGGGRGTGPTIVVDDEHGQPDTIPVTPVELAELLDPTCGPDDGGHARALAKAEETRARTEHTAAWRAWRDEAQRRLRQLTPDERSQLEAQALVDLPADSPRGAITARIHRLVMSDTPHPADQGAVT